MKRKWALFVAIFALVCGAAWFIAITPNGNPLSVSLLGYTNEPAGSEAALAVGNESQAVFELTNHSATALDYHMSVDVFKLRTSHPESTLVGSGSLAGHTANVFRVVTPGGTNGWRFLSVVSASGSRPRWQHRMGAFLGRVGIRPHFLSTERLYPSLTNSWVTL